jgi:hypothetical protein
VFVPHSPRDILQLGRASHITTEIECFALKTTPQKDIDEQHIDDRFFVKYFLSDTQYSAKKSRRHGA